MRFVEPPLAVSVTVAVPTGAEEDRAKFACTTVPFDVMSVKVKPDHDVDNETLHRFEPPMATLTVEPRCAWAWLIVVQTGAAGGLMVIGAADCGMAGLVMSEAVRV